VNNKSALPLLSRKLPAYFALSILACAVSSAYAADVTDLGSVGASDSSTGVSGKAATVAISQGSLSARSAQSTISNEFVREFTSPIATFDQAIAMAPGMFATSPNGVGLGDASITMRGYSDSNAVISFDGIPFNDTNGVSHHPWAFFPSQFVGGAVIDRSPGSAATIGQATFGGNVDILSRTLEAKQRTTLTTSYGTWNTSLIGIEHETGQFGADGNQNLLINAHQMKSDGYQTFNDQNRDAVSVKYQYTCSPDTVVTAFASYLNLKSNTPAVKGVSRANVNAGNYNYLLSDTPGTANYFGYEFYNIDTDFNYIALSSNLGNGWQLDDKVYVYRYWNKQNYNNFKYGANGLTVSPTPGPATGIDKLNSYTTKGNLLRVSHETSTGTLRAGLWTDVANSFRYQYPDNPATLVDQAVPKFSETYQTVSVQPYVEYEFKVTPDLKVTPGVKYASYHQSFVHLADNGGAVGNLNGAASVTNSITYTDVLPSFDVHYQLRPNWASYFQYAKGDQIPSTSVFDVKNAVVATPPKATKSATTQIGSVWKSDKYTLDVDLYHTKLDNPYSQTTDLSGNPVFTLNGSQINQGIEAEGTIVLGSGFSLYGNATYGSAKYDTGLWVAGAPKDTETLGLTYKMHDWNVGGFAKRVGQMYNDNGGTHQAFLLAPVTVTNLFVNYQLKNPLASTKLATIQFDVNNLLNKHSITSVAAAGTSTSSSAAPSNADLLAVLPARSMNVTLKLDF